MKSVFIVGVNGFVGQHAAKAFRDSGWAVSGCGTDKVVHPQIADILDDYFNLDVTDPSALDTIDFGNVTAILNLAGIATNQYGNADFIKRLNVEVHTKLYDHFSKINLKPRIIAISSGTVYASGDLPQTEISQLKNIDDARPYEASKILLEQALEGYSNNLDIIIVRPYNHIGPGQALGFLIPDMATEISKAIKTGSSILTGNLETLRDFTDVRDVVRAYVLLAEANTITHKVYNVCSGKSVKCSELVDALKTEMGANEVSVQVNPTKLRSGEINEIYGSHEFLTQDTGWVPKIDLKQTLHEYVMWLKNSTV